MKREGKGKGKGKENESENEKENKKRRGEKEYIVARLQKGIQEPLLFAQDSIRSANHRAKRTTTYMLMFCFYVCLLETGRLGTKQEQQLEQQV